MKKMTLIQKFIAYLEYTKQKTGENFKKFKKNAGLKIAGLSLATVLAMTSFASCDRIDWDNNGATEDNNPSIVTKETVGDVESPTYPIPDDEPNNELPTDTSELDSTTNGNESPEPITIDPAQKPIEPETDIPVETENGTTAQLPQNEQPIDASEVSKYLAQLLNDKYGIKYQLNLYFDANGVKNSARPTNLEIVNIDVSQNKIKCIVSGEKNSSTYYYILTVPTNASKALEALKDIQNKGFSDKNTPQFVTTVLTALENGGTPSLQISYPINVDQKAIQNTLKTPKDSYSIVYFEQAKPEKTNGQYLYRAKVLTYNSAVDMPTVQEISINSNRQLSMSELNSEFQAYFTGSTVETGLTK